MRLCISFLALAMALPCAVGRASEAPDLAQLVNAYRAAPGTCHGQPALRAGALKREPALSKIRILPGTILVAALDAAGYEAEQVDAIQVSGPPDVQAAFAALVGAHCRTLLQRNYSAIGTSRQDNTWTVVLARPTPDLAVLLPDWEEAGRAILAATNAVRARPQVCGSDAYGPARPLSWNDQLAEAARMHSEDMARHRAFNHRGTDGSDVGVRARQAGYAWRTVGENISVGQRTAEEVVAGWLGSPGHCRNLMNPTMTEMGAAFALRPPPRQTAYWTQVLGRK